MFRCPTFGTCSGCWVARWVCNIFCAEVQNPNPIRKRSAGVFARNTAAMVSSITSIWPWSKCIVFFGIDIPPHPTLSHDGARGKRSSGRHGGLPLQKIVPAPGPFPHPNPLPWGEGGRLDSRLDPRLRMSGTSVGNDGRKMPPHPALSHGGTRGKSAMRWRGYDHFPIGFPLWGDNVCDVVDPQRRQSPRLQEHQCNGRAPQLTG